MPPRQAVQVEHGHRLQAVSLASDLAGIGFSLSFCQVAGLALPCPRARARSLAGAVVGSLARKKGKGRFDDSTRSGWSFCAMRAYARAAVVGSANLSLSRKAGSRFLAVLAVSTPRGRATPVRVLFSFVSF
jgi:hypothetical protein